MSGSSGRSLPPLRGLDDFVGSGARFDLPHFSDPKRFSNRTTSNLLYYQTNYFVLYLVLFTLLTMIYLQEVMSGLLAAAGFIAFDRVVFFVARMYVPQYQLPVELVLDALAIFIFSSSLNGLFHIAFVLVLPTAPIVVHSCCRLRNVRNKLDRFVSTGTLMNTFLSYLNVSVSDLE